MSNVYTQEPPTSGKVILSTNHGDLEIELWTKETPRTCRNFIQLCLEGFYDNTVFHRIIRSFMVQGGDPTGTGQGKRPSGSSNLSLSFLLFVLGGESIYGGPF